MSARSSAMPASRSFMAMQGLRLVQVRDRSLGVAGVLIDDLVVVLDGGGEFAGAVVDLADVVVGVAGKRVAGVARG